MKSAILWLFEPAYLLLWTWMRRSGLILACSDAPDMGGVNQAAVANAEIGREQLALAREELAANKLRQAEFDPLFKKLIAASIAQQDTATEQSASQWKSYKDTWQPIEQKLAKTAAEFDTPERRASEAAAAGADVGIQFDRQRDTLDRDLARSNISMSSGKALALKAGSALDQAKATAGAESSARRQVEQAGIGLVDNAARFGRNMTSTGIETARLSLAAGQNAGGTMAQQQGVVNAGMAGAQGFYQGAVGANSSAGNLLLGAAGIEQQANASKNEMIGSLVGTGATAFML